MKFSRVQLRPPIQMERLAFHLEEQLREIENTLNNPEVNSLAVFKRLDAPERYADGEVYMADGESWDPESGQGIYMYSSHNAAYTRIDNPVHEKLKWFYGMG